MRQPKTPLEVVGWLSGSGHTIAINEKESTPRRRKPMASDLKLTDAEIIEVLATKVMKWRLVPVTRGPGTNDMLRFQPEDRCAQLWWPNCPHNNGSWNPLADPEGMGPIREIEARLTPEQRRAYIAKLYTSMTTEDDKWGGTLWDMRHASPRVCCEALCRVFQEGA